MTDQQIRFEDGAGYERMMGVWSRLAGDVFLDWLAPPTGLSWIDVGCGNGAFTELIVDRCAPAGVEGIDPSEGQLAFARTRPAGRVARVAIGDARSLPYPAGRFDAAVMALVIFFVPEPAKGVAEMVRVVRPGGFVSAYAWDMLGGGFPLEPLQAEMRGMGVEPLRPPSFAVSRMDALRHLWIDAGLDAVETREISVRRTFAGFDEFWETSKLGTSSRAVLATLSAEATAELKSRVRAALPVDPGGTITCSARANAVKGRVAKA